MNSQAVKTGAPQKVVAYVHAFRCLEPCGGVGRHANSILSRLAARENFEVSLLLSRQYLDSSGSLPENFPLRDLPFDVVPARELWVERCGRLFNFPKLDRYAPKADLYYSPMEGRLPVRHGKNIVTIHDVQALEADLPWSSTPEHQRFMRKWRYWVPKAVRSVSHILTVSEFSRRRMIELLNIPPEKISVVGNGVEQIFFDAGLAANGNEEKRPEVIVLGGLRYKKGAEFVFAVADRLASVGSPIRIVAIGQHEPIYEKRCAVHPQMELTKMISDRELVARLSGGLALMLLSQYEGFGIPALEAMAVGTPAIVSDRASLPEVVGDAGFVVDPEDAAGIVGLLEDLYRDDRLASRMISLGRKRAAEFTWDRCVDRLVSSFQGLRS